MSGRISVRFARSEDAAAVASLIRLLALSLEEVSPLGDKYTREYLNSPGAGVLVAEAEGRVAGVLSYTLRPNLYHAAQSLMIEELIVAESWRKRGIGGRLLDTIVDLARREGCAEVSVSTTTSNVGALALYRRHGFRDEAVLLERHLEKSRENEEKSQAAAE